MAVEEIAQVVDDLLHGRTDQAVEDSIYSIATRLICNPTIVDATPLYDSNQAGKNDGVYLYEDHPCIAPPWEEAMICYENKWGNVTVMHTNVIPVVEGVALPWEPAQAIELERVKWRLDTLVWVGGKTSTGIRCATRGPVHMLQYAIYDNGEPADLHWVQLLPDVELDTWDQAQLILLGTLNFLNCRNVEIVDPVRPRAERRRLERIGVKVHTISVFPAGKTSRSPKKDGDPVGGVPLTSVRGHFARYGPEYDRGLLFGKYAGRFWIPQFARGSAEHGESRPDYRIETNGR